jgi:hypothetical protein
MPDKPGVPRYKRGFGVHTFARVGTQNPTSLPEPASHVPGAPVASGGQAWPPTVQLTEHTTSAAEPTGWHTAPGSSGQLCSSLHGSYAEPAQKCAASIVFGALPSQAAHATSHSRTRRIAESYAIRRAHPAVRLDQTPEIA